MRFSFILALTLALLPWGDLHAREIYKSGHYTVRKVEGTCKLEIQLHKGEGEPAAILALFPSDDFYGELFTEKPRIGVARDGVRIRFDNDKARNIAFVPDAEAKDSYWRWQYLESTDGVLDQITKKNTLSVSFSNSKKSFKYSVSLKGSGKAVSALRQCQ